MSRRLCAVALTAAIALLSATGASAVAISTAQLQSLAARASAGDQSALAQLRTVSQIDGRPAHLSAALEAHTGGQLQARLRTLAASNGSGAAPAGDPQGTAASILAAQQYHSPPLPDPLGTLLHKLGHALGHLASTTPGGPPVFWGLAGALALAVAALGARRMLRRLDPVAARGASAGGVGLDSPEALERAADAAEERGAFADAIRLRFRAGLLALGASRVIEYRPSMLTNEVSARLHSPQFDTLAESFERVAYGGAGASAPDAAASRDGWRALLARSPGR